MILRSKGSSGFPSQGPETLIEVPHRVQTSRPKVGLTVFLMVVSGHFTPESARAHGDVHERIDALSRQIASTPTDGKLYVERAGLYRLDGEIDRALADVDIASAVDPGLTRLDLLRGALLLESGLPHVALVSLDRFLRNYPDHTEALLTRARIHARLAQGDAAAADYTRAIAQMDHPSPDCYLERANVLHASGSRNSEVALCGLDEGIQSLGPVPALQGRAIDLEIERGNFEAALTRLQTLIDQSPGNGHLRCRKGDILRQTGQPEAADAAYHEALNRIHALPRSRRVCRDSQSLERSIQRRLLASVQPISLSEERPLP